MNLEERFNQPFDQNYGLNSDGSPTQDFIDFTHSDDIYRIVKMNVSIGKEPHILNSFLSFIGWINSEVCLSTISLTKVSIQQLEEIIPKFPYLQNLYDYLNRVNLDCAFVCDYQTDSQSFDYHYHCQ